MYTEYFGLRELPFSISPDPRYLYMSAGHQEALAHLVYGINSDGGFVLLTGEVGTGKTTVCRRLFEKIPDDTDIAFILNPKVSVEELLGAICDELRISYPEGNKSVKVFVDSINRYLLENYGKGRRTVLIIEEAQNLSADVLEQVRLLTNLETNERKLLQIIMLGQPELLEMLARPELRQLSQRITARYHLGPLSKTALTAYVSHRLETAGAERRLFQPRTLNRLYRLSKGIPRLVNIICDRALLGAYVQGRQDVDPATLGNAAKEVLGNVMPGNKMGISKRFLTASAVSIFVVTGIILLVARQGKVNSGLSSLVSSDVRRAEAIAASSQTLRWPDGLPLSSSRDMAFNTLFRLWQMPSEDLKGPLNCDTSVKYGLQCIQKQDSFRSLRMLNRPAMLKFYNDKGLAYFVVLTSLNGNQATFIVGDQSRSIDIADISENWFGEYTLLWKPPRQFHGEMKYGFKGEDVDLLYRLLLRASGKTARGRRYYFYDRALEKQVMEFQENNGILPDGIAGPETFIRLMVPDKSSGPVLANEKEKT